MRPSPLRRVRRPLQVLQLRVRGPEVVPLFPRGQPVLPRLVAQEFRPRRPCASRVVVVGRQALSDAASVHWEEQQGPRHLRFADGARREHDRLDDHRREAFRRSARAARVLARLALEPRSSTQAIRPTSLERSVPLERSVSMWCLERAWQ